MAENWKELSENNMGLVYYVANKHKQKLDRYSVYKFEDLIAEGSLALVNAARNFDPNNGAQFSSYACACIDGAIKSFINKVAPVINYGCRGSEIAGRIVRDGNEHDPIEDLMEKYRISKSVASAAKQFIKDKYYVSLNEKPKNTTEGDADEFLDLYMQYNEDYISNVLFDRFYDRLTEKEKRVVIGRMIGETNLEIGKNMGVSGEMIRLHIQKIRKKFNKCFYA